MENKFHQNALTSRIGDVVGSRRHGLNTVLTDAVFSPEGNTIPSRKVLSEKHRKRQRFTYHTILLKNVLFCLQTGVHNKNSQLLANSAHKAGWVVILPQDCDHLSLHKFPTAVAERAMEPLEI